MSWLKEIWQDFSHLMFPYNCAACEYALSSEEYVICNYCLQNLPQTMYWTYEDNMVASTFYGRLRFSRACSFLYFTKGEKVQHMLHQLKYAQQPEVGRVLGELFGQKLAKSPFADVDCIIPVPLHAQRLKTRGYNQCDHIVQGMAEVMEKQFLTSAVKRIRANETQTKKGRYDRWINVHELFSVVEPQRLAKKHVLLVDDVVTTGATLEAFAKVILSVPGTTISIATIASPSVI